MKLRTFFKSTLASVAALATGMFRPNLIPARVRVEDFSDLRTGMKFKSEQGFIEFLEIPHGDFEFDGKIWHQKYDHLAITKLPSGEIKVTCWDCHLSALEFYA